MAHPVNSPSPASCLTMANTLNKLSPEESQWAMFHITAQSQLAFLYFIYGYPGRQRHTRCSKYLARNSAPVTLNTFVYHRLRRDVSAEPHWCNCALWSPVVTFLYMLQLKVHKLRLSALACNQRVMFLQVLAYKYTIRESVPFIGPLVR